MNSLERVPPEYRLPKLAPAQDFTVVFFDDSARPDSLPPFPYAVTGSAAGRVKLMAYITAISPDDVQVSLCYYFPNCHIESIDYGRLEPEPPCIHGIATPRTRIGFWRKLTQVFN